ncbi:ParB-like nuclease domain-containing protein [Candidatus Saccharibacteria bacterium]|nr:ParB-like nuclease domain-containing protein [Candidatus Saccharibacteria bacterium]
MTDLKTTLKNNYDLAEDKAAFVYELRQFIHEELSVVKSQPIDDVRWVNIDEVTPNDYNPNSVARVEMGLLYKSIEHDGYTQPVVTIWDDEKKKYVIVDGFHRYFTCKGSKLLLERNKGMLPIVVIKKDINDRMAATVRHNRARGAHSITGMSNMVFKMLENGMTDSEICNELGMEAEEILKLKHITGFSKLFQDTEYKKAWETKRQMQLKSEYKKNNG